MQIRRSGLSDGQIVEKRFHPAVLGEARACYHRGTIAKCFYLFELSQLEYIQWFRLLE